MMKNHLKTITKHTTQLCHLSCEKENEMKNIVKIKTNPVRELGDSKLKVSFTDLPTARDIRSEEDLLQKWWIGVGRYLEEDMNLIENDDKLTREEKDKKLEPLIEKFHIGPDLKIWYEMD